MSDNEKTTAMQNDGQPVLAPQRRFPEFQDAGGWEEKPLSLTVDLISGMHLSPDDYSSAGEIPYFTGPSDFTNDLCDVTKWTKPTVNVSQPEDILITVKGSGVGEVWFSTLPRIAMGRQLMAVRAKHGSSRFIFQLLQTKRARFEDLGSGNLIPGLSRSDILELRAFFPSTPEQSRIADCLTSVDELIEAQVQQLGALKTHKSGLIRQLFPREGDTQPRLRFPEFQNAGDWEEVLLDEVIEEFREKSDSQNEFEVLTSSRTGLVRQRDYYDNDRITERDNIGFNIIPPNYLTYRSRSDDRQFFFNENNLGITGVVSTYYPVFRIKSGSSKFFLELLSSFSAVIGQYSVGTSQTVLSLNQVRRLKLPFPGLTEQQRIAECLTSLDNIVTNETKKLDGLKFHKKGLMQQLFPSANEVEA